MRTAILLAVLLSAAAASADDTRPPVISEVKSSLGRGNVTLEARITDETGVLSAICHHRGRDGRVEDSPMIKNEYDDVFKVSFAGGAETEYWIESSDLLGNGPALYGSPGKPFLVGGSKSAKATVAQAETAPPPQETAAPRERKRARKEPPAETQEPSREPERKVARIAPPPVIEHRKPSVQPPEGREFTVRMKIHSEAPVAVAKLLLMQPQKANFDVTRVDGDSYEAKIPAEFAKGTVEYFIAAKNQAGTMAQKGDSEDNKTPYVVTFKSSVSPSAGAQASAAQPPPAGPFGFTHNRLYRVMPNRPILVRAQVVPSDPDGQLPDRVAILFRGNDGQDQILDMGRDENGGYGGFKAELPPQEEGAVFYQVVACDATASKCGVDTGSKRRWHAAAVAAQPGAAQPSPLEAVSQRAPPSLPE